MPYKRRNYRRYRKPKGKSLAVLNKKVNKIERVTKPEKKEHITNMGSTNMDFDGAIAELSQVPVGTGDQARIGTKVQAISLNMRGTLTATGILPAVCRVIFYKDKSNLTTLPAHLLRYAGTAQAINSPYSDDHRHQFVVLSDRVYKVAPNQSNDSMTFNLNKRLNFPLHWNDAGDEIVNPVKVAIFSNHSNISANKPIISMAGRVQYTDC